MQTGALSKQMVNQVLQTGSLQIPILLRQIPILSTQSSEGTQMFDAVIDTEPMQWTFANIFQSFFFFFTLFLSRVLFNSGMQLGIKEIKRYFNPRLRIHEVVKCQPS